MSMNNPWQNDQAEFYRKSAKDQADNAYNQSLAQGASQDRALANAKFAWQQTMDKAGLTGKFEGEWTIPAMTGFANQFGTWGAPTAGQKTQSMLGQEFGQGATNAQLYGQYYAPGTGPEAGTQTLGAIRQGADIGAQNAGLFGTWGDPTPGQQTLAAGEQGFTQNLRTQQEARALAGQQQNTAQNYLSLLSQLRGPADWAKYQEVLGSTPNGMRDLVGAAMGQYVPGGGATTGMRPQAVSLQSMMGDVTGNPYGGQGMGVQMPGQAGMPQQQFDQARQQWQQAQGGGQAPVAPAGDAMQLHGQAWGDQDQRMQQYQQQMQQQMQGQQQAQQYANPMQASVAQMFQPSAGGMNAQGQQTQQAYNQAQQQRQQEMANPQQLQGGTGLNPAMGNGTNMYGAQQPTQAQQMNLPAPNQIAAQSWKNMAPSQQQMLLGAYEAQGWHKPDVQALYEQSLPKYAGNAPTAGTFKLGG